jgi:hypothetical protein
MAGNDTKQTLPEARASLEAAIDEFQKAYDEEHQPLLMAHEMKDAAQALLAALKAAELGEVEWVPEIILRSGRDSYLGIIAKSTEDNPARFINELEGKRGVLFFAEDEA